MDPVFQYIPGALPGSDSIGLALSGLPLEPDNKWWFWDETWTDAHGPFDTKVEADKAVNEYARSL